MNLFNGKPRDPNRIAEVLDLVGQYWMKHTDLRLGQILGNFAQGDPYNMEDTTLITKLREELAKE